MGAGGGMSQIESYDTKVFLDRRVLTTLVVDYRTKPAYFISIYAINLISLHIPVAPHPSRPLK